MRIGGPETIYECAEHGDARVPISELLKDGELDIYPGITGKGYFDIDYRDGKLIVHATRYVGLIPISDRVAIHVRPKTPVGNLLWMVWRARAPINRLEGVVRTYQLHGPTDSPEALYVDTFIRVLSEIARNGLLKRYHTRENERKWKGRLEFSRSVNRFYARGVRYGHVFSKTELTSNVLENQIIRHTAHRLVAHLRRDRGGEGERLAMGMIRDLQLLERIDDSEVSDSVIARVTPRLVRALPAAYSYYEPALWLAYLIATSNGISMERVGNAKFESILVNVADVFESYVRRICVDAQADALDCVVRDGNKRPIPLFVSGASNEVKPDLYFLREGDVMAVADAKYKMDPGRDDRYELLAFCEATGVKRAAFICPLWAGQERVSYYGTTRSGLRIDIIRVDLAAADMEDEEARLVAAVRELLGPAAAVSARL